MLLIEELAGHGCQVEFSDRPMSDDPHDQLLQIRGAVAEYERTLITEQMRRGRQRQLDAAAGQRLELQAVAGGIERFCQTIRAGLAAATFGQRRQLAESLIDRVIVTDDQVEIRYVLPTSSDGPHRPFCQLRKDHLERARSGSASGSPGRWRCGPS